MQEPVQNFISRVRFSKPVGKPVRIAGHKPGNVHLHIGHILTGVQSVLPASTFVKILWMAMWSKINLNKSFRIQKNRYKTFELILSNIYPNCNSLISVRVKLFNKSNGGKLLKMNVHYEKSNFNGYKTNFSESFPRLSSPLYSVAVRSFKR